jgi:tol-pal system protein YbgF
MTSCWHLPKGPRAAKAVRRLAGALFVAAAAVAPAHALFEDDEARKAILDLRQRLEQVNEQNRAMKAEQAQAAKTNEQLNTEISTLRRSLLDLNNQLELLRTELARMRGQDEQIARDVAELQRRQADITKGVDERVRRLEPQKVVVDGKEFLAEPDERKMFEDALAIFRKGDFAAAASALQAFQRRYPTSGYTESVLFWLGNAQYGLRQYKEAIESFRTLVRNSPDHPRAPEALLSIANCQIELKDSKTARRTIDELVKAYPASEAANAGRERLASLK